MRARLRKLFAILVSLASLGAVLGLAWAFLNAGEIYQYQDSVDGARLPRVDAIVVLAGGRGRIAAAGDVWYRYWELRVRPIRGAGVAPVPSPPPMLYFAGMGERTSLATVRGLLREGVREVIAPERVIVENQSRNTAENAEFLASEAARRGWERILLITSPYHMKRARLLIERELRRHGIQAVIDTFTVWTEPFDAQEWRESAQGVRVTLEEFLKLRYLEWRSRR